MALGDTEHDGELHAAWEGFLNDLRTAESFLFQDAVKATPAERAEAFRYLTQSITLASKLMVENKEPLFPFFVRYFDGTQKQAGDNCNAHYHHACIDGRETYRIAGNRGSARWLIFSVLRPGQPGTQGWEMGEPYNYVLDSEPLIGPNLQSEWDGSFVLTLSPEARPENASNWIQTSPEACAIRVRQFFDDWEHEEPATIRIERVGVEGAPPLMSPARMVEALRQAGQFVVTSTEFWPAAYTQRMPVANEFVAAPANRPPASGSWVGYQDGNPRGATAGCHWVVGDDKALIVEFVPLPCLYWSLELYNVWATTVDYRWRLGSLNGSQAVLEADGRCLVVLAHQDPGVPNWIDLSGWHEGRLGYRGVLSEAAPAFTSRLVKLAELDGALPADVQRITPDERREQLRHRKNGVDRRFRL